MLGRICVFHPAGLRLETTGTTGKNNFGRGARTAKRIHRPKSAAEGSRQSGAARPRARAPKESCFKQLFPIIKKPCGELCRCALQTFGCQCCRFPVRGTGKGERGIDLETTGTTGENNLMKCARGAHQNEKLFLTGCFQSKAALSVGRRREAGGRAGIRPDLFRNQVCFLEVIWFN